MCKSNWTLTKRSGQANRHDRMLYIINMPVHFPEGNKIYKMEQVTIGLIVKFHDLNCCLTSENHAKSNLDF